MIAIVVALATLVLTPREQVAMHHLMTTRTFEYPHVGEGMRSNSYLALRVLARSKSADEAFKTLVAHAAPAGQLYGLMGVSRTDPEFFRAALAGYRKRSDSMSVANGCDITSEQLASIVYDPRALQLPSGTTLARWLTENPNKPSFIDIAGGGLTSLFLDPEEPAIAEQGALAEEKAKFP